MWHVAKIRFRKENPLPTVIVLSFVELVSQANHSNHSTIYDVCNQLILITLSCERKIATPKCNNGIEGVFFFFFFFFSCKKKLLVLLVRKVTKGFDTWCQVSTRRIVIVTISWLAHLSRAQSSSVCCVSFCFPVSAETLCFVTRVGARSSWIDQKSDETESSWCSM